MLRIMLFLSLLLFSMTSQAAIVIGNTKGSVTLVEVFDYQCSHCQKMAPIVDRLIKENLDLKVRLLPVAINKNNLNVSLYQAAAAIAATQYNNAFAIFHALSMSNPPKTSDDVLVLLNKLNLATPDFKKLMHSDYVREQLNEGLRYLDKAKSGTPLLIIYPSNNPDLSVVLKGEQSYKTLSRVIHHAKTNKRV